jgi:MFS family permease
VARRLHLTDTTQGDDGGYPGLFRRNPDFTRLYIGQLLSYGGDWFLTVALLDLVLDLTGSGLLAALLAVCQTLPAFLLAPYAGAVVDRVDRRRLMIGVNLFAAVMALLPLLTRNTATLPFAYIGVIGISSGVAFFSPASQAALPNVVRRADLSRANVLIGSSWGMMLAVGAAVGGLVTAWLGKDAAILIDSACLSLAALLLWSIRTPFQEVVRVEAQPFLPALREAGHYARRHRRVLALLTSKGGFGIGAGVVVLLSVFSNEVFRTGAIGIGVLYSARGIGALLGPLALRRVGGSDLRTFSLIGVCGVLYGIGYAVFAVSPVLAIAAGAVFVAHLGGGAQWTISSYGLQRLVPDEMRGRIFAADFALVTLTTSLSSLGAGLLADTLGRRPTALLMGLLALAWGLIWTLWTRGMWAPSAPAVGSRESAVVAEESSTV